jgi:glycosyltransferase involved in cell wall biosynthesis
MLNSIYKIFFNKTSYNLQDLLDKIELLSIKKYMSICPQNTDSNWLGILNASNSIFPGQNISLPQYYSNQVISDKDLLKFISFFKTKGGEHIILNGFPEYFFKIVELCNLHQIKCTVIYHGGLAELNQNSVRQQNMKYLFELAKKDKIQQFGVIKKGLEVLFHQQTNVPCHQIDIPFKLPKGININKFNDGKIHIGIFGNDSYNKNRHTQVAAASLVPNSVVHFVGKDEFDYLLPTERKVQHHHLNYIEFLNLLGSMDVNLYCSFTESYGQIVLESLALGVPCIHNNNSDILYNFPELKRNLVIDEYDNIVKISEKVISLISNPIDLSEIKNFEFQNISKLKLLQL